MQNEKLIKFVFLLTAKAQVIIRTSVSPLRKEEVDAEDIKEMKRQFT